MTKEATETKTEGTSEGSAEPKPRVRRGPFEQMRAARDKLDTEIIRLKTKAEQLTSALDDTNAALTKAQEDSDRLSFGLGEERQVDGTYKPISRGAAMRHPGEPRAAAE